MYIFFFLDQCGPAEYLSPSVRKQYYLQKYSLTCHITWQTSLLLLTRIHKAAGVLAQTYN